MNQKERIIQYVLNTPCNNNRQILESLLSDGEINGSIKPGQMIKVKNIDSDGTPIEWEAADMCYSEITEVVVGTGANNGWFATVKPDGTIPKLRINGTIYENVQNINTGGNPTYQVGKYQISISPNAGTWTIIPNDISANDLEFLGTGTVYHPVPDEYIPEWVANKNDIAQSDWNETDRNSPAFIFNKPSIPVQIIYDPYSSTKYSLKSGLNIVCMSSRTVEITLEQFPQISADRIITTSGVIRSIKTGKLMTQSEYPYGCAAFWYLEGAHSIAVLS